MTTAALRDTRRRLAVWLHDRHIADLTADRRGGRQLRYLGAFTDDIGEGHVALSVALPVRAGPYRGRPNAADFSPEGERWVSVVICKRCLVLPKKGEVASSYNFLL
jgi:hypothetical protein